MSDDIVARLRGHIAITTRVHYAKDGFPEPVYVHGPSPICQEAADEIERLRAGGCARDQRTTQFCAQSVELERQVSLLEQTVSKIEAELKIARDAHADWRMEATRCRKERDDAKARNVLLLSKLQEYEAREQ